MNGTGEQMVMVAINLGWQLAEIYAFVWHVRVEHPALAAENAVAPSQPGGNAPLARLQPDLPGVGSFTADERLQLMFEQVDVWVWQLKPVLSATGLTAPDNSRWPELSRHRHSAEGRQEFLAAILSFHCDMLTKLTAADYRLGRAYGLGRALADLSLRPRADSRESFTEDLRYGRVQTISSWLGELHTALPDHAAGAVQGSIAQWQEWAAHPQWDGVALIDPDQGHGDDQGQGHGASQGQHGNRGRRGKPGQHESQGGYQGPSAVGMLRAQGKRWRSLLTGQVAPLDELAPEDYVDAADYLLGRVKAILQRLLGQYLHIVLAGVVIMIAAVVGAFFLFQSPVGKSAGAAVSFLAWLGITWKMISAALQRAVGQVEESLWQCELDLAVARAITRLPGGVRTTALGEPAPTLSRAAKAVGLDRLTGTAAPAGTAAAAGTAAPPETAPPGTAQPGTAPPPAPAEQP